MSNNNCEQNNNDNWTLEELLSSFYTDNEILNGNSKLSDTSPQKDQKDTPDFTFPVSLRSDFNTLMETFLKHYALDSVPRLDELSSNSTGNKSALKPETKKHSIKVKKIADLKNHNGARQSTESNKEKSFAESKTLQRVKNHKSSVGNEDITSKSSDQMCITADIKGLNIKSSSVSPEVITNKLGFTNASVKKKNNSISKNNDRNFLMNGKSCSDSVNVEASTSGNLSMLKSINDHKSTLAAQSNDRQDPRTSKVNSVSSTIDISTSPDIYTTSTSPDDDDAMSSVSQPFQNYSHIKNHPTVNDFYMPNTNPYMPFANGSIMPFGNDPIMPFGNGPVMPDVYSTCIPNTNSPYMTDVCCTCIPNTNFPYMPNANVSCMTNENCLYLPNTNYPYIPISNGINMSNINTSFIPNSNYPHTSNVKVINFPNVNMTGVINANGTRKFNVNKTLVPNTHVPNANKTRVRNANDTDVPNTNGTRVCTANGTHAPNTNGTHAPIVHGPFRQSDCNPIIPNNPGSFMLLPPNKCSCHYCSKLIMNSPYNNNTLPQFSPFITTNQYHPNFYLTASGNSVPTRTINSQVPLTPSIQSPPFFRSCTTTLPMSNTRHDNQRGICSICNCSHTSSAHMGLNENNNLSANQIPGNNSFVRPQLASHWNPGSFRGRDNPWIRPRERCPSAIPRVAGGFHRRLPSLRNLPKSSLNNFRFKGKKVVEKFGRVCGNCETTHSKIWKYDEEGKPFCNTCRYFHVHHRGPPPQISLKNIMQERNRRASESEGS